MRSFIFATLAALVGTSAQALPEAALGTRQTEAIVEILKKNDFAIEASKRELATTGIPALDFIWNHAQHFKTSACNRGPQVEGCLWMSRFDSISSAHPVVILPGFTEYRKQYLEFVADLQRQGYGPIYVLDFRSHGQSFKPFLKEGERLPTVGEFVAGSGDKVHAAYSKGLLSAVPKVNNLATMLELNAVISSLDGRNGDARRARDLCEHLDQASRASRDDGPARRRLDQTRRA